MKTHIIIALLIITATGAVAQAQSFGEQPWERAQREAQAAAQAAEAQRRMEQIEAEQRRQQAAAEAAAAEARFEAQWRRDVEQHR